MGALYSRRGRKDEHGNRKRFLVPVFVLSDIEPGAG
jgi:hypothetical protein